MCVMYVSAVPPFRIYFQIQWVTATLFFNYESLLLSESCNVWAFEGGFSAKHSKI